MRLLTIFAMLLVATALATGGVAAQDNSTATNETESCTERINEYTAICDAELDGSDVVVTIHTEGPQTIVVTEAFRRGSGELTQRHVDLDAGVNTVRLTVTVDGGSEGVTIAAGDTLYQKEVTTSDELIGGPFTATDAQAAGIGGGLGVAILTVYLVAKAVYGRDQEPERLA
ncbi:hypothetical protein [Halorubrum sp. DTA46]|uniref:hypothetical protein n=1 Tax=Halorubrum sp. DTA46 TaxID=3402162 RepID=UPI003AAC32EA